MTTEEHRTDGDVVRSIWARTSTQLLHGRAFRREIIDPKWWQRLVGQRYERGTYFEFGNVTLGEALAAFDTFLADPKEYAIETAEGCCIEVVLTVGQRDAFLDAWFSDGGIEDTILSVSNLRPLLQLIYESPSDREIAGWLREHGTPASADGCS